MTFPTTHSILSAAALAEAVQADYDLGEIKQCWLFNRGLNDTYMVDSAHGRFVLRVYRNGWRSDSDIAWELGLLRFLNERGLSVSAPVARSDGHCWGEVAAPEGRRQTALFTFAPGSWPKWSKDAYYRYGRLAARLHTIADGYEAVDPRFSLDIKHLLDAPLASIEPFLGSQPDHWRYLADLSEQLKASLASLPLPELEWGVCHGDLHNGNLHEATGDFTLFDFDCGGPGWRAYDLAVFRWAATRRVKRPWTWFLQGYRSMRTLAPIDAQAVPIFVMIRQVWWLGLSTANAHDLGGDGRLPPAFFEQHVSYLRKLQSVLADLPPVLQKQ